MPSLHASLKLDLLSCHLFEIGCLYKRGLHREMYHKDCESLNLPVILFTLREEHVIIAPFEKCKKSTACIGIDLQNYVIFMKLESQNKTSWCEALRRFSFDNSTIYFFRHCGIFPVNTFCCI